MIPNRARSDSAAAERLLSGPPTDGSDLARLLAAATAPARPDELAGEAEAVRSFHLARRARSPVTAAAAVREDRTRGPRWAWALAAKVVAIVLATAGAGWALAASAGVLPAPWQDSPATPAPVTAPGPSASPVPGGAPASGQPPPSVVPTDSALPTSAHGQGAATTDQTVRGLCQAFIAHGEDMSDLTSQAFARVVEAAGGVDQVPAFCEELLAQAGSSATPQTPPESPAVDPAPAGSQASRPGEDVSVTPSRR